MVNIWVISDTHFGHDNIIWYCSRPFAHADEMGETLVENWNRVVKPPDHVYHLGDVAMSENSAHRYLGRLNGHLRLILGNHDDRVPMHTLCQYFDKILCWRLFKPLIFTHVPIHQGSFGKAVVNVHGHIHQNPTPPGPYINVSVEAINYTPVHLDVLVAQARRLDTRAAPVL